MYLKENGKLAAAKRLSMPYYGSFEYVSVNEDGITRNMPCMK